MSEKLRVGILGGTGMVGQRFISLLENHPWFEVTTIAASPRSAGKTYEEAVGDRWKMDTPMPEAVKKIVVMNVNEVEKVAAEVDFVFSAVDMTKEEIKKIEEEYAKTETPVVSNNSAHRWTPDVPMVVPEVNPEHMEVIKYQKERLGTKRGFVAVKPNCSIQSYAPVLTAWKEFEPYEVVATTYQAISGAGKTFKDWPENVYVFKENRLTAVEVPERNLVIHGAAFSGPEQPESLLAGFTAPADGKCHIGLLHGELDGAEARYGPIRREEAAASGLCYLALGHVHKRTAPLTLGRTVCAWPGCPEGRGFDELGEKGFYEGTISDGGEVSLTFVPFARHRYEVLEVDVTGKEPRAAVEAALPPETAGDLYRILLTGETGEGGAGAAAIQEALADRFYALEVRDRTRMAEDLWRRAEEDSLRGLFLRELRQRRKQAETEAERAEIDLAARFGLAALDHRDLG